MSAVFIPETAADVGALPDTLHGLTDLEYNYLYGQMPSTVRTMLYSSLDVAKDTGNPAGTPDYLCMLLTDGSYPIVELGASLGINSFPDGVILRILNAGNKVAIKCRDTENFQNAGIENTDYTDAQLIDMFTNGTMTVKGLYTASDDATKHYLYMDDAASSDFYELYNKTGAWVVYNQGFLNWMAGQIGWDKVDKAGSSIDDFADVDTAASKATPVDADSLLIQDSTDSSIWKKLTWANCKATLKTYFDTFWGNVTNQSQQIRHGFYSEDGDSSFTGDVYSRPASAPYTVYIGGVPYVISTAKTLDIGALAEYTGYTFAQKQGQWFVWYYVSGGVPVLNASKTPWNILDETVIPVDTAYANDNGAGGIEWILAKETHGDKRNLLLHKMEHDTDGARWVSGLNTLTVGTGAANNSTNIFSLAGGVIRDEDKYHTITNPQTQCRIGYKNGSTNAMKFDATASTYAKLNAGVPQYDNAGTLTNIATSRYGVIWQYATNRYTTQTVHILGQADYTSVALAQAAPQPTLYGLSAAEWKLVNRIIIRNVAGALNWIQTDPLYLTTTGPAASGGGASTISAGNVTTTGRWSNAQLAIDGLDVMTAAGDLKVGGVNGVPARLAMGSALQGLRVNAAGTGLEYAAITGGAVDYTTAVSITSASSTPLVGRIMLVSGTGNDYMVGNFPSAASNSGQVMHFKIADSGATKLYTINGKVYWSGEIVVLWSDGSNWIVIEESLKPTIARANVDVATTYLFAADTDTRLDLITVGYRSVASMINTTAGQGKIVIPRTSVYMVTPFIYWYSNHTASGKVENRIYKNGSLETPIPTGTLMATVGGSVISTQPMSLTAGDTLELHGYHGVGTFTTRSLYSSPDSGLMVTEVL